MKSFFNELFEYNHHFNQKLISIMVENSSRVSERSIKLVSHVVNAHQIWNCKFLPEQERYPSWEIHPIQNLSSIDKNNFEQTTAILDKFELTEIIQWFTAKGQQHNNTVRDILFQVINHSTYHRGQIATEFRESGLEPVLTDYIFYKMNRE